MRRLQTKSRVLPSGPSGWPFVGILPQMWKNPLGLFMRAALDFGDIALIDFGSRKAFLVNHPDYIKHVLLDNYHNYNKGITIGEVINRVLGEGLTTSQGALWRRQRRLMQPAFHYRSIAAMSEVILDEIEAMLIRWQGIAGQMIDVRQEMMSLALTITVKTMFGTEIGEEANEISRAWRVVLQHFNTTAFSIIKVPTNWATPANRRFEQALATLERIVNRMIAEGRQHSDRDNVLSMLLRAQDEETGQSMSDKLVRDEVMNIFLAAHETTANTMTWGWYLLSQAPTVLIKLRDELKQVLNDRVPTVVDLTNLPYTSMIIDETLRLYPAFWLTYRAAYEADQLGDFSILPDDMILMSAYVMHRHPRYWHEPNQFKPERFAQDLKKKQRFVYFPFGAGPRICIGNSFALMQAQLALAMIAQRFDLVPVPNRPVIPEARVTLQAKDGFWVTIQPRN